jgi:hypothetical protein
MRTAVPLAALLAGCGSTGTPMCQQSSTSQAINLFCAPTRVSAGKPLHLQLREQCGSCTQYADRCEVLVTGQSVKLRLLGQTCMLPPGYACATVCASNQITCTVPALPAGTYQVTADVGDPTVIMMTTDPVEPTTDCIIPIGA